MQTYYIVANKKYTAWDNINYEKLTNSPRK